jgi:PAS domain S-box-containing protein
LIGGDVLGWIFDDLVEGVQVIDFDFRYVYLNRVAAHHGRRTREELIGRRMGEMYPGIEDSDVYRLLRTCMNRRTPQQMVNRFVYPDGRSAWFDLRVSPVPIGIMVMSVDISEQKAMEEQLRQSRDELAAALDAVPAAVVFADMVGLVTRMNPDAESLTGWPEEEARGRPISEVARIVHGDSREVLDLAGPAVSEARRLGTERRALLLTRDGTERAITAEVAPLRDAGQTLRGAVLVLHPAAP